MDRTGDRIEVSAILFDIGDTLVEASNISEVALKRVTDDFYLRGLISNRRRFLAIYRNVDANTHGPRVNHLFSDIHIIRESLTRAGYSPSLSLSGQFLEEYRAVVRRQLRKDRKLISLFRRLKDEGFQLGIVTDGTTNEQMEQLASLGLVQYVDVVVTSEEAGVEKPDPKIFKQALARLSVHDPSRALMVGDDISKDIVGATNLGIRTALVGHSTGFVSTAGGRAPDLVLKSALELPSHLSLLRE